MQQYTMPSYWFKEAKVHAWAYKPFIQLYWTVRDKGGDRIIYQATLHAN